MSSRAFSVRTSDVNPLTDCAGPQLGNDKRRAPGRSPRGPPEHLCDRLLPHVDRHRVSERAQPGDYLGAARIQPCDHALRIDARHGSVGYREDDVASPTHFAALVVPHLALERDPRALADRII